MNWYFHAHDYLGNFWEPWIHAKAVFWVVFENHGYESEKPVVFMSELAMDWQFYGRLFDFSNI